MNETELLETGVVEKVEDLRRSRPQLAGQAAVGALYSRFTRSPTSISVVVIQTGTLEG